MKYFFTILTILLFFLLSGVAQAVTMWASASSTTSAESEIFKLDTSTGKVVAGSKWSYTGNYGGSAVAPMSIADSGDYLYGAGIWYSNYSAIQKLDRTTGASLGSQQFVGGWNQYSFAHLNALEYANGKLYAVDNTTVGANSHRGHVIEMTLDASGDVDTVSVGAYIGAAPDGALEYREGNFYASSWKSGGDPGVSSIMKIDAADIGDSTKSFTELSSTTPASGLMDGWQFDSNGDLIAVSWQNDGLYSINPTTGGTTTVASSINGVSSGYDMSGLDAVVPEPTTWLLFGTGLLGLVGFGRKKFMKNS